eukprot:915815-Pleurochrysis_carterae.AAC.2
MSRGDASSRKSLWQRRRWKSVTRTSRDDGGAVTELAEGEDDLPIGNLARATDRRFSRFSMAACAGCRRASAPTRALCG